MALSKSEYKSKSDFDFVKRLRKGGFGAAYLVKPKRNAWTEYVLKEVNLTALDDEWQSKGVSENQRRRLLEKCRNEHLRIQEVHHPNIVQVFGAFEEKIEVDDCYFMLMEFCDGGDLDQYLRQQRDPVPEALIRQWAKQLVGAISHLHEHGLVHRDIKPQNIFLTAVYTKVKLGDFGLVKDLKNQQFHQGSMTSAMSHSYASPELIEGKSADRPCDIWALGVTLYEVAHLKKPFEGMSLHILGRNILTENPAPFKQNRGYSAEFRDFTMSIFVKDPNARPDILKLSESSFLIVSEQSGGPVTPSSYQPSRSLSEQSSLRDSSSPLKVDVSLIAQSTLIVEPMRSEICRILQENLVTSHDLSEYTNEEISLLLGGKFGAVRAVIKWRDAVKQEMRIKRQQDKEAAEKEAETMVKGLAERIKKASQRGKLDELRKLIDCQIVPIITTVVDNDDQDDASKSVKERLANLLSDNVKIDLDVKYDDNYVAKHPNASLLHESCYRGDLAIAKYLVEQCGLDVTARTSHENGHMPIHLACLSGNSNVVEWLCEGWPEFMVEARRLDGCTPMHQAAMCGRLKIIKYLVVKKQANVEAKCSKFGRTPVISAAQFGQLEVVKYFVERCNVNLDVQSKNEPNYVIIHLAAYFGQLAVVEYLLRKRPDFLEINAKNGQTPLQVAIARDKTEVSASLKSTLKKGVLHRAMYDYEAMEDDECTFFLDDLITNVRQECDGWVIGTVIRTGQRGMIPSNYIEPLTVDSIAKF